MYTVGVIKKIRTWNNVDIGGVSPNQPIEIENFFKIYFKNLNAIEVLKCYHENKVLNIVTCKFEFKNNTKGDYKFYLFDEGKQKDRYNL